MCVCMCVLLLLLFSLKHTTNAQMKQKNEYNKQKIQPSQADDVLVAVPRYCTKTYKNKPHVTSC